MTYHSQIFVTLVAVQVVRPVADGEEYVKPWESLLEGSHRFVVHLARVRVQIGVIRLDFELLSVNTSGPIQNVRAL